MNGIFFYKSKINLTDGESKRFCVIVQVDQNICFEHDHRLFVTNGSIWFCYAYAVTQWDF